VIAISRTGLLSASLAGPANLAIASAIEAVSVVTAVAGAGVEGTIVTGPAGVTRASEVVAGANTMSRAAVGANFNRAISSLKSRVAMANSIIAKSSI